MADEIQQIKKAIASNDVLIVVGPDISICTTNNGGPNVSYWHRLFKHGLERCRQLGRLGEGHCVVLSQLLEKNNVQVIDYLLVADQIKYCFKENEDLYKSWLIDTIEQFSSQRPELIKAIEELNCPILTTNYDLLLEENLRKEPFTWQKYPSDGSMNNTILHTHGHYKDPDSIAFTSEDYSQLRANESIRSRLETLVENKTVLLIGYECGRCDPNLSNLLQSILSLTSTNPATIYKLVRSGNHRSLLENVKEIPYGDTLEDLLTFVNCLQSFSTLIRENRSFATRREHVCEKYLKYLIEEYGHVSIFGYSTNEISLPLESVYVELRFDPTHPSIRAMKSVDVNEEFKRCVLSYHFFDENEKRKLTQAIRERDVFNLQTIYRDLMINQWLNVLLSNRKIFSEGEATTIKRKISRLKQSILEKNNLSEARQYQIREAYFELKHFLILGHPGSGKTTLSKWLVMNMAHQCLGKPNMLFDSTCSLREKIPILIPIWKYVDQSKEYPNEQKRSLLHFIHEHATLNSPLFTDEERKDLSLLIMESLLQGNVLVIFEGLDEVPDHVDRTDLLKEINSLLERGIDYDPKSGKLIHSLYEQKEISNTRNPTIGNRFLISSRIEGNYFEEINFYIPRLTIQDMSNEALRLFCNCYTQSMKRGTATKEFEKDRLYNEIAQNKDIFQLAINPQLASVIAAVYNQYEDQLPEKRIDLYEQAIKKMIDRLVTSSMNEQVGLTSTLLWSILQNIAEYLHSKVEGLSENSLREIIRKSLIDDRQYSSTNVDDFIGKLVEIFKYKVGLLNEFGYNSFRFIHRTFQEYLAAKSLIYFNGRQRSADAIYEKIMDKIAIPNWRVPLSMTFGILSQFHEDNDRILTRLLTTQSNSSDRSFSTLLVPFVLIDSLSDMTFTRNDAEDQLIHRLADMLLIDYKNLSGFARLPEHQKLIHSYFFKLKNKSSIILITWFIEKITNEENIAPCANILHQLKWFHRQFHQVFLTNLHHDSQVWTWPVDSLLRFYSTTISDVALLDELPLKRALLDNWALTQYIRKNADWLALITALYGGYANYQSQASIAEYLETAQFLRLSDIERMAFILYYQNIWGRDDPAYNMAVHLDNFGAKDNWQKAPLFDPNEIYKESFLTPKILQFLSTQRSATDLIEDLREQLTSLPVGSHGKVEAAMALIALGETSFLNAMMKEKQGMLIKSVQNRLEQLICVLQDPIARCSSQTGPYLLTIANQMKSNPSNYNVNICDYCRIYLSLLASSGGFSVETTGLAELMENIGEKSELYAEYLACKLTGASKHNNAEEVWSLFHKCISSMKSDLIIGSLLKMSDAVQLYRPVRAYSWPMDQFSFQSYPSDDIPIAFFNCLENINTNLAFGLETICDVFIKEGYFSQNADLIPLIILLIYGMTSKGLDKPKLYAKFLPELAEITHIKLFLFDRIHSMNNPYYKSRAMYQLAQFYDERSLELLNVSFQLVKDIPEPALRFQVLEKIYSVVHYKEKNQDSFIEQIVDELVSTVGDIEDLYDRVIASIRLAFYGTREFRKKCLADALQILTQMDENREKIHLLIKLKPLVSIDDELRTKLKTIIDDLHKKTNYDLVNSSYGQILSTVKSTDHFTYIDLKILFRLVAQLNDAKLIIGKDDCFHQLWTNVHADVHNQFDVEKLLADALHNEIFLTPQVAMIVDDLVQRGEEHAIDLLLPYMTKASNEVLPIVHRWFTKCSKNEMKGLAGLLLVEARCLFEGAMETMIELLEDDRDQIRYRVQRIFQHPQRDPKHPSKQISIIGEKVLVKILQSITTKSHLSRVSVYLRTFFYDLRWDDPQVFENLHRSVQQLQETFPDAERNIRYFNRMNFIDDCLWESIMQSLQSPVHPFYVEDLLHSTMNLVANQQINEDEWRDFAGILANTDTTQFRDKFFFTHRDIDIISLIIDEIFATSHLHEENYFENLESKLIREVTINVGEFSRRNYDQIKHICICTFRVSSKELNEQIIDALNPLSMTHLIFENLLQWAMKSMMKFHGPDDSMYSMIMCDNILSLVAACVQKEDYLYRKISNSFKFNKSLFIELLNKIVHRHPYFPARGAAFIMLAALDLPSHQPIIKALNTLFDENLVKTYTTIGIPLIHLPANEFIHDLFQSLNDQSAIKVYELLKLMTQFALDEKIDANCKSQMINYIAKEIGQFKSKKLVNYYYTDIKIPFTTTLEKELYKTWIKIQGLAGKTLYTDTSQQ